MKNLETIIREVVDAKAEQNNQIDLHAYENGMRDFAKAINYTRCCTEVCDCEVPNVDSKLICNKCDKDFR